MFDVNKRAQIIHQNNIKKGWWPANSCPYTKLQLVSTEVAEATEGSRKNLKDDHLKHRDMFEVELADALIRIMDLGGHFLWEYTPKAGIKPMHEWTVGRQLLDLNETIVCIYRAIHNGTPEEVQEFGSYFYSMFIDKIFLIGSIHNLDILGAMEEKIAYNATRLDHTKEHRDGPDGKKW